jgi:hypothetical protein
MTGNCQLVSRHMFAPKGAQAVIVKMSHILIVKVNAAP